MVALKNTTAKRSITISMLVDASARFNGSPVVLTESKAIIAHLWKHYGRGWSGRRWMQFCRETGFHSLSDLPALRVKSALRPLPSCGLLRTPSTFNEKLLPLELYQAEHCPESRLVREKLSTWKSLACIIMAIAATECDTSTYRSQCISQQEWPGGGEKATVVYSMGSLLRCRI